MRLIDKDLVLKTAKDKEWGLWCEIANIKFAPEVKAIPVEWVVKRINYYSDLILKYPNEKELLYSQTELISLLEDWEKENERV